MVDSQRFADLGRPRRVWAVAAIHADVGRLLGVQREIGARFRPGDRLILLGNMIGTGPHAVETVDALLRFRRELIARPGVLVDDVVYLRGAQEEMWQKLLQLHFAPNPLEVLQWMLGQGVAGTLAGYGGDPEQGVLASKGGPTAITRWTQTLRDAVYAHPGHGEFFNALRRAAFVPPEPAPETPARSDEPTPSVGPRKGMLFVNAGLDPTRPVGHQGDSFWWGASGFGRLDANPEGGVFGDFCRIVRGHDPHLGGVHVGDVTVTLDGGCGRGGPLVCAAFDRDGALVDSFQV